MNETRYPLCWPANWKRTPKSEIKTAQFGRSQVIGTNTWRSKTRLSIWDGVQRVFYELYALEIRESDIIISTNVPVRNDGVPRSDRAEPTDRGVAVYWKKNGKPQCMPIDRYHRVADNLAAVAATLEALRAIERHGGGAVMDRAFAGFAQLPAAIITARPWRDVFRVGPNDHLNADAIETRFRGLARQLHPDLGGSHESMTELNAAREAALKECSS
jgi:hypothetical protein